MEVTNQTVIDISAHDEWIITKEEDSVLIRVHNTTVDDPFYIRLTEAEYWELLEHLCDILPRTSNFNYVGRSPSELKVR